MLIHGPRLLPPAIPYQKAVPAASSSLHRFAGLASGGGRRPDFKLCRARRRPRYEEEEEYSHNAEIAMLEDYTQSARSEALLVRALVAGEEEQLLVFKGFSSSLSSRTATDPSKSVLPAEAIIKSIDVVKGPFDPSCIEYIEKDLTLDEFKVRLLES